MFGDDWLTIARHIGLQPSASSFCKYRWENVLKPIVINNKINGPNLFNKFSKMVSCISQLMLSDCNLRLFSKQDDITANSTLASSMKPAGCRANRVQASGVAHVSPSSSVVDWTVEEVKSSRRVYFIHNWRRSSFSSRCWRCSTCRGRGWVIVWAARRGLSQICTRES
jgi:hypothetical protein